VKPDGSSALELPTVVVQEGGYDLATLGSLVRAALEGIEEGRTS
jgi:acetoin utilization deacetylase AcuC-like enzyme